MDISERTDIAESIIDLHLPLGGCLMLLAAYFDESESQGDPPNVMTVAGYLVKDAQAKRMTREIIKGHDLFGIEFFHQAECALGVDQYAHLTKPERVKAQDYLRAVIKRRTMLGRAVSISIDQYRRILGDGPDVPTPYAFACISAFVSIRRWIEASGFDGRISYFFESGYKDQSNGRRFVDYLMYTDAAKQRYRMASFAHADKRDVPPLQASDMLAWYTNQEFSRLKNDKTERRKDFAALIRPQDMRMDHTRESLERFKRLLDKHGTSVLMAQ